MNNHTHIIEHHTAHPLCSFHSTFINSLPPQKFHQSPTHLPLTPHSPPPINPPLSTSHQPPTLHLPSTPHPSPLVLLTCCNSVFILILLLHSAKSKVRPTCPARQTSLRQLSPAHSKQTNKQTNKQCAQ